MLLVSKHSHVEHEVSLNFNQSSNSPTLFEPPHVTMYILLLLHRKPHHSLMMCFPLTAKMWAISQSSTFAQLLSFTCSVFLNKLLPDLICKCSTQKTFLDHEKRSPPTFHRTIWHYWTAWAVHCLVIRCVSSSLRECRLLGSRDLVLCTEKALHSICDVKTVWTESQSGSTLTTPM